MTVGIAIPFALLLACAQKQEAAQPPKTEAHVGGADAADGGLRGLPEIDPRAICDLYARVGKKLGADIDARLDAGPMDEAEAKALMQHLSPGEAVPVVRAVMKDMLLRAEDVVAYERAHPEIVQRCVSAMTHHLQPSIMRVARATSGIPWRVDLARAQKEAAAQKKPLLYVACASWERACRELDRTTFQDPRVKPKLAEGSVLAVYDDLAPEDATGTTAHKAAPGPPIDVLPTVILFDRSGAEQKRWSGFVPGDLLAPELVRAIR